MLRPILGPGWARDGVPAAYASLRREWRSALDRLQGEGWVPVVPRTGGNPTALYPRNCPPFGVLSDTRSMPCGQRLICPNCWARAYVAAPYDFLGRCLAEAEADALGLCFAEVEAEADASPLEDCVFAVRRVTRNLRLPDAKGRPPEHVVLRCLQDAYYLIANRYHHRIPIRNHHLIDITRYPGHRGGVVIDTVEPVPDGVEFSRSTVVLVDRVTADAASVPREFGPASVSREYPANKKGLAGALGFAAAYPAGILRAPRTSIEDLLQSLGGLRMLTFHEARDWGPDPDREEDAHVTRGAAEAP